MDKLFTIGFTKKTAKEFFEKLNENNIHMIVDVRLNNTSQLAGFTKYPDIVYFLKNLCNIDYIQDKMFSPEETTLKKYKKKGINWEQYVKEFNDTMENRNINEYIYNKYNDLNNICLLCSEPTAEKCHRSLVADRFRKQFKGLNVINL